MNIVQTEIEGVLIIEAARFEDERGYFIETYNRERFHANQISYEFVQDNLSLTLQKGTIRGIHLQKPPFAQAKLVTVLKGKVLDIAVDLRKHSKTYGKYVKVELSENDNRFLMIPESFGHAFLTLEANTLFSYKCSKTYHKESETCLAWNDNTLNIDWGIENPIVSEKDALGLLFSEFVSPF